MTYHLNLKENGYDIVLLRGALHQISDYLNLNRKVLVVTDSLVPKSYSQTILSASKEGFLYVFEAGEERKNFTTYQEILSTLLKNGFSRHDCVVAVGGGVTGDMAGFAAATYMRGIDFYNIPTTLLSMVDSSIGGKTAIDFEGVKNIVGAFYQPKKVIIDPETLSTLPKRQLSAGLAEALKMSLTFDENLFSLFETKDPLKYIDQIIEKSLMIKGHVVEVDEKESGLRKVLNFGHTLGHGIESVKAPDLLHGECVSLGMIPMIAPNLRARLIQVLLKLELPTSITLDLASAMEAIAHDKKSSSHTIDCILVNQIGSFEIQAFNLDQLQEKLSSILN